MHAGDRLHDPPIAHAQTVPINGLHAPDIGSAELRQRNAGIAVERAWHAGRPEQFFVQMAVHELVDVAQVLQQLPGLAERRRDQLDQRLGKIRGDVLVGERCPESRRVRRLHDVAGGRDAQRLLLDALAAAAQHAALPRIDEPREPALEFLVHHVSQTLNPRLSIHGNSATTSISTRKPGSTSRCTCTQEAVGSRSLP